jgi:hypothetical protein
MPANQESRAESRDKQKSDPKDQLYLKSLLNIKTIPPPDKLRRTTILNTLADKFKYQCYLEIGLGRKENNYDWVECRAKTSVDPNPLLKAAFPMTSDQYFALHHDFMDLIFVDGLHHADQVERDIANSLNVLKRNGTIVVHDCNPTTEEMQIVPGQSQQAWTGDVWKAWVKLRATRADLTMAVVNVDNGCGIIRRGGQETIAMPEQLTYPLFEINRAKWLNLISIEEFLRDLRRYR